MSTWQKTVKYLAMMLAIFLSIGIIGGICGAFGIVFGLFGGHSTVGEMQTYSVSQNIARLEIDLSAAELVIQSGDEFRVESDHKYLSVQDENGCLTVTEEKRSFFSFSDAAQVIVTVPTGMVFDDAQITTGAAAVTIERLETDTLRLELGAGEVIIDSLTANAKAEIEGGAGRLVIRDGCLYQLDLDMGAGKLELTAAILGRSSINYGVGATDLVLLGTAEDYRIDLDKGLGSATIDGNEMRDGSVYGDGENKLEIDGGVGALKVTFRDNAGPKVN